MCHVTPNWLQSLAHLLGLQLTRLLLGIICLDLCKILLNLENITRLTLFALIYIVFPESCFLNLHTRGGEYKASMSQNCHNYETNVKNYRISLMALRLKIAPKNARFAPVWLPYAENSSAQLLKEITSSLHKNQSIYL